MRNTKQAPKSPVPLTPPLSLDGKQLTRGQISAQLKEGDISRIAEITSLSANYISRVITMGDRESEYVLDVARKYLRLREQLEAEAEYYRTMKTLPEKI